MDNLKKWVEFFANVAIVLVACLLSVILVKNYLLKPPLNQAENPQAAIATATDLAALDVDWHKNNRTLVLALSTTCHFCTESAPFYRRLHIVSPTARIIAILPQSPDAARNYLGHLGVTVDDVRQADFNVLKITGTPTLLLVGADGTVLESWVGKLAPEQQVNVERKIQGAASTIQ